MDWGVTRGGLQTLSITPQFPNPNPNPSNPNPHQPLNSYNVIFHSVIFLLPASLCSPKVSSQLISFYNVLFDNDNLPWLDGVLSSAHGVLSSAHRQQQSTKPRTRQTKRRMLA